MTGTLLDGIYESIAREVYERSERANFSTLKWMAKSPAHYRHVLITPAEDTDPMRLGRVSHLAAFEPERFRSSIAVWEGKVRNGKEWDSFCQRNAGLELLTTGQYEKCMAIQRAVRAKASATKYLQNGRGEVTLLWTTPSNELGAEIACKGRIDFDAQDAIVDLKTTADASQTGFARQVVSLNYHTQAAWYSDGYFKLTGIRKPYVIVAVESAAPFEVVVYRMPEVALQLGRDVYDRWLDQLAYCRKHSMWPGYTNDAEVELELPAWAMPEDEADLGLEVRTRNEG